MENTNTADKNTILFEKVVDKRSAKGTTVGQYNVSLNSFKGSLFIKLHQHKNKFGFEGNANYKPEKDTSVTFSPEDSDLKEAIIEAFKRAKK